MTEVDFLCNYRGCGKPVVSFAWITKCSHIFCEGHGNAISQNQLCPACNERLLGNMDAVYQNLNPPEMFKSMILTGLRPEIIIDIIARSMTFRTYQMAQERAYYNSIIQMFETNIAKLESAHKTENVKLQNDIAVLSKREEHLVTELEKQKFRAQEAERIIGEKNLQMQQMQMRYESLRCHNSIRNQPQRPNSIPPSYPFAQTEVNKGTYMTQENLLQGQNQTFQQPIANHSSSRMEGSFNEALDFEMKFKRKPRSRPPSRIFVIHEDQ